MVPQGGHDLAHDHLVAVLANEAEHENAVLSQVVLAKSAEQLLVELLAAQTVHELEIALEEGDAVPGHRVPDPEEEAVDGGEQHVDEPEPDGDEDLLVEQVDGQGALDHVVVDVVAEKAHLSKIELRRLLYMDMTSSRLVKCLAKLN